VEQLGADARYAEKKAGHAPQYPYHHGYSGAMAES